MKEVGSLTGIFRYPVKSMLGENLDSSRLELDGIPGDRCWGVRDEARGDFFVGKRSAALMGCSAWYPDGADTTGLEAVPRIRVPDGQTFSADSNSAARLLSQVVERDVTIWPVVPEARQATPKDDVNLMDEMQEMMARTGDEPIPDFSDPAPELLEVYARGGPFFDAFPLLLMSQRSIDSLAEAAPESAMDVRRFRPNLLVETDEPGPFPERDWIGKRLRIGQTVLSIHSECIRCVMTTHGFADLPKDPRVMRTLVRKAGGNLGVYALVEEFGEIRRDDSVTLLD